MKNNNDTKDLYLHIDQRLDQLEKLLTLLLLSNTMNEYIEDINVEIGDDVISIFEENDYAIIKKEIFGDKIAVYVKPFRKVGLKEIRKLKDHIDCMHKNLIVVFMPEKLVSSQRKKLFEEKISFLTENEELYIVK